MLFLKADTLVNKISDNIAMCSSLLITDSGLLLGLGFAFCGSNMNPRLVKVFKMNLFPTSCYDTMIA